jgi:hypothetical protein
MPERLAEQLGDLAGDVQAATRPQRPAVIRARGDRRHTFQVATAAIALGLGILSAGTLSIVASGGVGPATAPSPSAASPAQAIVESLPIPHDGQAGWVRNDDPFAPGAFNPCGVNDVTLIGRVDAVTMTGPGRPEEEVHSPTRMTQQVLLFETPEQAWAVLRDLAAPMARCDWSGGLTRSTAYGEVAVIGRSPADLSTTPSTLRDAIVAVRGNAMILHYSETTGALMSSVDNDAIAHVSAMLCAMMRLCDVPLCQVPRPSPLEPQMEPCASPSPSVSWPSGSVDASASFYPSGSRDPYGSPYGTAPSGSAYPPPSGGGSPSP